MTSVSGIANVHHPQLLCKETTCTINIILHQWKDHINPHIHSTLGMRQRFNEADPTLSAPEKGDPTLSTPQELAHSTSLTPEEMQALHVKRADDLLQNFNYLHRTPTHSLFSADYFQDLIMDHLYIYSPMLWKFIDSSAPHAALDNLFALGAAVITASIHHYWEQYQEQHQEGKHH